MRQQYHSRETDKGTLIWNVHRIVRLSNDLPIVDVLLDSIVEFDESFWFDGQTSGVTCRQVAEHAILIQETELKYPIILSENGRVMDGTHRVTKAWMQGDKSIEAVRFSKDPEPDYVNVDLDSLPYHDLEI